MEVIQLADSLPQPVYSANLVLSQEGVAAKNCGLQLFDLMKRAGKATFDVLCTVAQPNTSMLIVAGKGNNGGDGYVVANLCANAGYKVTLLILCAQDKIAGDALKAFEQIPKDTISICIEPDLKKAGEFISGYEGDLIVDAIFGIGFYGSLDAKWQCLVSAINCHYAQVISIDVPSGLDASTGHVDSIAVIANVTITFIVLKQGLLTGKSANYTGQIWLATLGVQDELVRLAPADAFAQGVTGLPQLTPRLPTIHKGSIGLVLAIGGNIGMPGAIKLAAEGALRAGASLVAVTCHELNQPIVIQGRPELMLAPHDPGRLSASSFSDKAKVILVGPGLGRDIWARQLVKLVADMDKALVVDADALAALKDAALFSNNWVLTPHPGEAAYLLDTDISSIEKDRFSAVKAIAQKFGGICVLKGAGSLISDGHHVFVNTTGNAGMASGGMGDVLSGIIAALILQSGSLLDATRLAVSIHGQAAQAVTDKVGIRGLLASDLFEPIREIVNRY